MQGLVDRNNKPIGPRMKGHIMFCLPGNQFSGQFLEKWTYIILNAATEYGLSFSRKYTPVVSTTRNNILGGFWMDGEYQKPFKGEVPYDYLVWIDDDQAVAWSQIQQLIAYDKPVVAGWTATAGLQYTAMTEKQDEGYRAKHGMYPKVSIGDMEKRKDLFKCYAIGFGLVVIQKGVVEKLRYPWFGPIPRTESNGVITTMSDDESFCFRLREAGFDMWVDPTVRIGHEKTFTV